MAAFEVHYDSLEGDRDNDLAPPFPEGGMRCPVTLCGPHKFTSYRGMRAHWRKRYLASVRLHSCPLCPDEHPKRCSSVRQLQTKHFVSVQKLAIFVQQIASYKANYRKFIDPGTHLCPGNFMRAAYAANKEPAAYASVSSSSAPATVSVPPPSRSSVPVSETLCAATGCACFFV